MEILQASPRPRRLEHGGRLAGWTAQRPASRVALALVSAAARQQVRGVRMGKTSRRQGGRRWRRIRWRALIRAVGRPFGPSQLVELAAGDEGSPGLQRASSPELADCLAHAYRVPILLYSLSPVAGQRSPAGRSVHIARHERTTMFSPSSRCDAAHRPIRSAPAGWLRRSTPHGAWAHGDGWAIPFAADEHRLPAPAAVPAAQPRPFLRLRLRISAWIGAYVRRTLYGRDFNGGCPSCLAWPDLA